MNDDESIPSSYEAWCECITVRFGSKPTRVCIESRLTELRQADYLKTSEFKRLYGDDQPDKTISWFEFSRTEVVGNS